MFSECIYSSIACILVLFITFFCTSGFILTQNFHIQVNFQFLTTDYGEKDGQWWCTSTFRDESKRKISKGHSKCLKLIAQNFTGNDQAMGFTSPSTSPSTTPSTSLSTTPSTTPSTSPSITPITLPR